MKTIFSEGKLDMASFTDKLKDAETRYQGLFQTANWGILMLDYEGVAIVEANPFILKFIDISLDDILGMKLWEIGLFRNLETSDEAMIELKKRGYLCFNRMPIQGYIKMFVELEFVVNRHPINHKRVIQCNVRLLPIGNDEERNQLRTPLLWQAHGNSLQYLHGEAVYAEAHSSDSLNPLASNCCAWSNPVQPMLPGVCELFDLLPQDEGLAPIGSEIVDINELCKELFVCYQKVVDGKKLLFSCSCALDNEKVHLRTNANRIKLVLFNLINNAIKFTQEGEVDFGYIISDGRIEFYVRDNGIGIEKDNHTVIFQRFRQLSQAGMGGRGGRGLGLAIAQEQVHLLGGSIGVKSELGVGSTFSFSINAPKESRVEASNNPVSSFFYLALCG